MPCVEVEIVYGRQDDKTMRAYADTKRQPIQYHIHVRMVQNSRKDKSVFSVAKCRGRYIRKERKCTKWHGIKCQIF